MQTQSVRRFAGRNEDTGRRIAGVVGLALLASCHHGGAPRAAETQAELERPLAAFATQRVVVTPTARVRLNDSLGWAQQLGGATAGSRKLDTSIVAVLEARGLASRWVL